MAKNTARSQSYDSDTVHIRIIPNGSSAPSYTANGRVASVTRTATGTYRITLTEAPYRLWAVHATYVSDATNEDRVPQVGPLGAKTIDVRVMTGTSAVDTTGDAEKFIMVTLHLEDSSA